MGQVMLRLGAATLAFIIGIIPVGLWRLRPASPNLERNDLQVLVIEPAADSELRQQVEEVRQRGESHLSIVSISCGMGVPDLRYALAHYSLVIARPRDRRTYEGERHLRSWYRFQVVETLSARPPVRYPWDSSGSPPPADLLPIGANEFVIPVTGGMMVINGVTVSHRDSSDPNYSTGQTYMLFLNLDAESRVAYVPWPDRAGIFTVNEEGTFRSINSEPYESQEQLQRRFSSSVDRLRQHFRR